MFVALDIQHEMRNAPYCQLWPVRLYNNFSQHLINGQIFKKMLMNIKCLFWLSLLLLSKIFPIIRKIKEDMFKTLCWSSGQIFMKLEFFDRFVKMPRYKISCKYVKWQLSCSMHMDRQMTKLIGAFRFLWMHPKMAGLAFQQEGGSLGVTMITFTTKCTSNPTHISLSIHINYIENSS
jgi:hypothetical protein